MANKLNLLFSIHPGELLNDILKELAITQSDFARHIHVLPKVVNEICRGKRGISVLMALKLSKALDMTPDYWLNAQQNYQLSKINQTSIKKIRKLVGMKAA